MKRQAVLGWLVAMGIGAIGAPVLAAPAVSSKPPADLPACPSTEAAPDVAKLVRRTEQVLDGRSSIGTFRMEITTPRWSRTLEMKAWSKGRDFSLIRILAGSPREVGMMTLKREDQLWNYLPNAGRVMKLPSGMMGDSWMGSDFTNDDLVSGSSLADDFTSVVVAVETLGGMEAWHIVSTPRPDAVTVWGKVELWLARSTCQPIEQRFYDEEGVLTRRMEFSEFRQVGWRWFPARMTVIPSEEGRRTAIVYEDIQFDVDIADDVFSLRHLQQAR
jgi:hypothetical protein